MFYLWRLIYWFYRRRNLKNVEIVLLRVLKRIERAFKSIFPKQENFNKWHLLKNTQNQQMEYKTVLIIRKTEEIYFNH